MARSKSRSNHPIRRIGMAAQNALELVRLGHLGSGPTHTPYKVIHSGRVAKLRRYGGDSYRPTVEAPLILVPPLMLTSEIYDVAPDVSAVSALLEAGLDVWVVDFGAPERQEGGLDRTLDDHVIAISESIDRVRQITGHNVHLGGYSQGGMFAYQTAAFRRTEGLASVITFGSPVDIHRNLPNINDSIAGRAFELAQSALEKQLDRLEALPGFLTSTGFKLLSIRKEVLQLFDFVQKLHDRQALEKREVRRRFLAGEGFVAWPGPALRKFIEEFVVHNRMSSGGFVIAGRSVSLADITCPILCFVGERDSIAQPASVRAIVRAAPNAEIHEVGLRAGHFGLVVGSTSLRKTWPSVVDWIRWQHGIDGKPASLQKEEKPQEFEDTDFESIDFDVGLFYDTIVNSISSIWDRLGDSLKDFGDGLDNLKWQVPRLNVLRELEPDTQIGLGAALSERAQSDPEATFFLWKGRAFSYEDADLRVDNIVAGLIQCGVRPAERVAILMDGRPSYLSLTTALNRLGAVAVLLSPIQSKDVLAGALSITRPRYLVCDPDNVELGQSLFDDDVWVLGGGGGDRVLPQGVVDMEAIDPQQVALPQWYEKNAGRARDLAMVMLTAGRSNQPRAARITNHRWAFSAYGTAAACTLSPADTVYCALPLHHPSGMLVAVGGSLVGGARLSLATAFCPQQFWSEVRRYGVSVMFYAGEMLRELLMVPASAKDNVNPLRLFAGSGLRKDVWRAAVDRFGPVGVVEFYASTEGNAVLANASGQKLGALGRPLPGSAEVVLGRYDFSSKSFVRDSNGFIERAGVDEPAILLARVDVKHPLTIFEGEQHGAELGSRIVKNAFEAGDTFFVTWDVLTQDKDGDYWFVDRAKRMLTTHKGVVATRAIEDALLEFDQLCSVAVVGRSVGDFEVPIATVATVNQVSLDIERLTVHIVKTLKEGDRPATIRQLDAIPMTDGFRPLKTSALWTNEDESHLEWTYSPTEAAYQPSGHRRATPTANA